MVTADVIPVLWLCGPSGVGKTTVGWEMYSQLVVASIGAGYVDIDQLGIYYREPASDPGRHKLKARNLNAVVAGFRAAGARCVVVSGVVDNARGPHIDDIARARLTVCRLRADSAQLQQRFVGRRKSVAGGEAVLREAEDLDASTFADVCIDTTGLSAHEVARHVSERTGGWPYPPVSSFSRAVTNPTGHAGSTDQGLILWLCGPTGVGKSTVGFRVYTKLLRRGLMAAYIDVDQIGFCGPSPMDHRLKARNLAAMWHNYCSVGAEALVVVGPVHTEQEVRVYTDALPSATLTWLRLHAGSDQLMRRIRLRREGGSWPQPGDPLRGQSTTYLQRVARGAITDANELERAAIGLRIDTDERTVEETADLILAQWDGLST